MTKKEFALKHFKEGAKLVVTENKIIHFHVAELVFNMHELDDFILVRLQKSRSPWRKEPGNISTKYIKEEHSGFDFYLVTEEY